MTRTPTPAVFLALCAILPAQTGQQQSSLEIAGGKVTVRYYPVALEATSLEAQQRRGNVWSMSDREAAILETDVALRSGEVLVPPGRYRLSTWFQRPGEWRLLIFESGKNFKSDTRHRSVSLRLHEMEKASSEMLRIALVERRGAVRLQLFGGTTRLRASFEPMAVTRHKGTIGGLPATYEFYAWRAEPRVQGRLRNFELIQFGRVRRDAEHGAVYDISCKSDGKGIFLICKSTTLRDNQKLLVERGKALQHQPGDEGLGAQVAALRRAVTEQKKMLSSVMVAGQVTVVGTRAKRLGVKPVLDSDGNSFELSFGRRTAKFTLNDGHFKKLQWK